MKSMLSMRRISWLITGGFILTSFFVHGSNAAAAEPKPINIGFSCDFSGVTAWEGNVEFPIFEMAVKELNAAGGINGRPIKLHVLDNGGDPSKTVGTLKVIKDANNCVASYYGINSASGIAAKAWADTNNIPIISCGPLSDKLIQRKGKAWFFRSNLSTSVGAEVILGRIKELGYKRVGFMGSTQAMGTDCLSYLQENISKFGLELVGSVLCEPNSKDLTIQAKRLRDTNPEAVIYSNYAADSSVWARNMKTLGWQPYVTTGVGLGLFSAIRDITPPDLLEGWESVAQIDFTRPEIKMIWDKYAAYTGRRSDDEKPPRTWDGAHLLFEAIRLGGNPDDPTAIRDGFYKIKNFPIVSGPPGAKGSFEIGRNYLITPKECTMVVIKSGKFAMVQRKK